MGAQQTLFISRAGADARFAERVYRILSRAGHEVVEQSTHFGHRDFMGMMHHALDAENARVIALYSDDWFNSDYCRLEGQTALYGARPQQPGPSSLRHQSSGGGRAAGGAGRGDC